MLGALNRLGVATSACVCVEETEKERDGGEWFIGEQAGGRFRDDDENR